MAKCQGCHGVKGRGGPNLDLAGGMGTIGQPNQLKTIGSFWPYATTIFDYVFTSMPYQETKSLTHDETYALTAYLLYINGIIGETDVIDAQHAAEGEDAEPRQVHHAHQGYYKISGLAWSGRGRGIVRKVEVSADGGKSWAEAVIQSQILPKAVVRFHMPGRWDGQPASCKAAAPTIPATCMDARRHDRGARSHRELSHQLHLKLGRERKRGGAPCLCVVFSSLRHSRRSLTRPSRRTSPGSGVRR